MSLDDKFVGFEICNVAYHLLQDKIAVRFEGLPCLRSHNKRVDFFFFCLFAISWAPQRMEVSRLGIEVELQPPAYATATAT